MQCSQLAPSQYAPFRAEGAFLSTQFTDWNIWGVTNNIQRQTGSCQWDHQSSQDYNMQGRFFLYFHRVWKASDTSGRNTCVETSAEIMWKRVSTEDWIKVSGFYAQLRVRSRFYMFCRGMFHYRAPYGGSDWNPSVFRKLFRSRKELQARQFAHLQWDHFQLLVKK